MADELDEDAFECAEEDLGEVNQVALGWQDDNYRKSHYSKKNFRCIFCIRTFI